nr:hypothetical protein [Roseibacterium elongatum]
MRQAGHCHAAQEQRRGPVQALEHQPERRARRAKRDQGAKAHRIATNTAHRQVRVAQQGDRQGHGQRQQQHTQRLDHRHDAHVRGHLGRQRQNIAQMPRHGGQPGRDPVEAEQALDAPAARENDDHQTQRQQRQRYRPARQGRNDIRRDAGPHRQPDQHETGIAQPQGDHGLAAGKRNQRHRRRRPGEERGGRPDQPACHSPDGAGRQGDGDGAKLGEKGKPGLVHHACPCLLVRSRPARNAAGQSKGDPTVAAVPQGRNKRKRLQSLARWRVVRNMPVT